ncbi:MAG: response regulator [Patescibacteria group bacterium]
MPLFSRKEKKRVLIVEDDALLAKVLVEKFLSSGFDVLNVMNGLEVLKETEQYEPAVILLDLILPGLDGFGVLKLLKGNNTTKEIPVVIMSNLGEESDVRSARALGAVDYFIKANMSMEKLVNFVKKNY